jgi:hypothetical protein
MAKMFGRAKVTVNGQEMLVENDSSLDTGGVKRNTVKGDRVYGFAEETAEAMVEMHTYIDANTDIDALNAMSDVTVLFQLDTGQNYVLPHAWLAEPVKPTAANNGGKATLKFAAASAEKM